MSESRSAIDIFQLDTLPSCHARKSPVPGRGFFVDISRGRKWRHWSKIADRAIGVQALCRRNFSRPFLLGYALHTAAGAVVLLTIRVAA